MIRQAQPRDVPAVLALLAEAQLPTEGVADHFHTFFVDDEEGRIVASAGLELHRDVALLRSLAVASTSRGTGRGFEPISRDAVPPELLQSRELSDACPSSATVLKWVRRK